LPALEETGRVDLPSRDGLFHGAAIVPDGDDVLLYGVDDVTGPASHLHVARLDADLLGASQGEIESAIRFWSETGGDPWSPDVTQSAPLRTPDGPAVVVSNQLSVVRRGTNLALVSQLPGGDQVKLWTAALPQGEWAPGDVVASCPAPQGGWTYNALLHPWSVADGKYLLSCNVNGALGAPVTAVHEDPSLYRPRFDRVLLP
jgi:hypothetical protein